MVQNGGTTLLNVVLMLVISKVGMNLFDELNYSKLALTIDEFAKLQGYVILSALLMNNRDGLMIHPKE